MLDEELIIISKLQKYLKNNYQAIGESMIGGGIDNMEKYKYMIGKAHAYATILQEISNLLQPKEQNDTEREYDQTNIVQFGQPED